MDDDQAHAYYATGIRPGARVTDQIRPRHLSEHIPIRFPKETVDRIKSLAEADGRTVSGWVRNVVAREIAKYDADYDRDKS